MRLYPVGLRLYLRPHLNNCQCFDVFANLANFANLAILVSNSVILQNHPIKTNPPKISILHNPEIPPPHTRLSVLPLHTNPPHSSPLFCVAPSFNCHTFCVVFALHTPHCFSAFGFLLLKD